MKEIIYNAQTGKVTEREFTAEEIAQMGAQDIEQGERTPTLEELRQMYEQEVSNRIRQRYSIDEELSILRQRDVKVEEFEEYNAYCEECKQEARIALNMVE